MNHLRLVTIKHTFELKNKTEGIIINLESKYQCSCSAPATTPRLLLNFRSPLKIFEGLSKLLPVFPLGTENVMEGGGIYLELPIRFSSQESQSIYGASN